MGGVRIVSRNAVYALSPARNWRSMFSRMSPYRAETTPPASRSWNERYRGLRSHQPRGLFHGYGRAVIDLPRGHLRHQQAFHMAHRRKELEGLERSRGVDVLRADDGALPHEGALPDAALRVEPLQASVRAFVPGIPYVPQGEGGGRRADEMRVRADDRAGCVAQHAVDAHALLLVGLDVLRILDVLLREIAPVLAHDVRLDGSELVQEIIEVHDEVLDDREVREGIDRHDAPMDVPDVRAARELRLSVHVRPAGAADPHAAGPAEGQGWIHRVLDVVQAVEDDHVVPVRDAVALVGGLRVLLGPVAFHAEDDVPVCHVSTSSRRAATSVLFRGGGGGRGGGAGR